MDNNRIDYFRLKLFEEKKKLLKTLNNMTNMEEYGSMDNYYNELSHYDNHPADVGTEVFMREQDEGFKNNLKHTLREIDSSLVDIRNARYGVCQNCGKKIHEARLEIIPYLKTCLECSEQLKSGIDNIVYESLDDEYITSFSFNSDGENGFDREDAYQAVAQFDMVPGDPSFSTGDYIGIPDEENINGIEDVENISQEYYNETLK